MLCSPKDLTVKCKPAYPTAVSHSLCDSPFPHVGRTPELRDPQPCSTRRCGHQVPQAGRAHRDVVGIDVAVFLLAPCPPEAHPALGVCKTQ